MPIDQTAALDAALIGTNTVILVGYTKFAMDRLSPDVQNQAVRLYALLVTAGLTALAAFAPPIALQLVTACLTIAAGATGGVAAVQALPIGFLPKSASPSVSPNAPASPSSSSGSTPVA